jgi:hypothetical protein
MDHRPWIRAAAFDVMESLMANARAVPADKLDWKPTETSRSVLNQMGECAGVPIFFRRCIQEGSADWATPEVRAEAMSGWAAYRTLGEIDEDIASNLNDFYSFAEGLTNEQLEPKIEVFPGWSPTAGDLLFAVVWNMIYHLGAISQIQLLLGDQEMRRLPSATSEAFAGLDPRPLLAGLAESAAGDIARNWAAMDEAGKLDWSPGEGVRSARHQLTEAVQSFTWSSFMLENRTIEGLPMSEEEGAAFAARIESEGVEAVARQAIADWKGAMEAVPAEDLDIRIDMFTPGWQESLQSCAWYPIWNSIYHIGAACSFQVQYGDHQMH